MGDIFRFKALVILTLYVLVNGDNYDEKDDDDDKRSLESDSNEVYNTSSKEIPLRVSKMKNSFNDNITISTCKDTEPAAPKEIKIINYKSNNNYPYSVSIQRKGSHYASGALVDKKWILTVAEEFYNTRETIKLFRVRLGSVNCKKGGVLIPLKSIEIHPSYVYKEPSFDIAMLRIANGLEFSEYIQPIPLSDIKGRVVSAKFIATYWPRLIINGKVLPRSAKERLKPYSMRVSTQRSIPWDKCYMLSQANNYSLHVSSICLEPFISHHSPCMPDAGAPIVADGGLWGITSSWISEDCLTHPSPTIFTRISSSHIRPWIDSLL
ncbi:hypodermin-A-like [Vanessa atalanta]|uniref:hypodermin-A-like n=1 Tax=Vanessa atalanta TaxID=42275 RepID=UPI001FCD7643|nr:hypodermin-A-like [Vanessa atalanta]